ncbi:reverse transcriptase domain-containing protein [Tanacetum coccineum]
MADHSQKWHVGSSRRSINNNNSNTEGIAAIVSKLDSLGRDMKKLKENIHAIQVGCQICGGAHLDKECPQNKEVNSVEEPSFEEKKPSLEELMNKHLEESTRRRAEMEEWIEQFTKKFHAKTVSEVNNSSFDQCKAVYDDKEASPNNEINEPHEVSFVSADRTHVVQEEGVSSKILSCQLPPKELNPRSFTLPCTIEILNFYVMADLGASINVIPKSMFEHLKLARLKKTDMLVEMADMTKRAPIGIVENILIKIDKFLFPSDFVVIDMLKTRNEIVILGRPFLATIHAETDVFNKEISLGIGDDRVTFDMNRKVNNFTTLVGIVYMINNEPSSSGDAPTNESSRVGNSDNLIQKHDSKKTRILEANTHILNAHFCKPIKQIFKRTLRFWPTCNPTMKACNRGFEICRMNGEGMLKFWYYYLDRKSIRGSGLLFPEFLLVWYEETQGNELI